jgi:O-antigen/teichoic acid export membrane protein
MFEQITRIGKHSVVYSIGRLLQRVASFLLIPMYTAYFTTSDYGIQEILSNTSSVLNTLLSLGLISGMFRSYYKYPDEDRRRPVVKTAFSVFAVSSALVGGVLILLARPLSGLLLPDKSYSPLLVLTFLFIIQGSIIAVPFAVLRAEGKSFRFVAFSLVQFLVNVGSTILLVVVAGRGVCGSLEGNLLGQLAVLLLFIPSLLRTLKARFSPADLKEMLLFGLPLVPGNLAALSLVVSDRYFLRAFSSFDEIGVYGLGYKISSAIQILIVTPFALSWGPAMWAAADKPYAKRFYAKVLTYFTAVALYVALGVSVLSPELIRLMSRREAYWRAWQVVPFITLSYVFYGMYYQMAVGINLRNKMQYISLIVGAAAVLNLLLNFVLIRPWGMMGAAISTLMSYSALALLVCVVSQSFYPFRYEWNRLLKLAVVFVVFYGVSWLISFDSLIMTMGVKFLWLLLCPLILYSIRFFSSEELARARELLEKGRFTLGDWLHTKRAPSSRD